MITHNTDITLDLSTDGFRAEVWAKQDDAGTRQVTARFVNSEADVSLAGVASAELRVLRPDGRMTVTEAQISGDTVAAVFPESALAVGGEGYGDIRLLDGEGGCISAARFILHIEQAAVSNMAAAHSSDLTKLLDDRLGGLSLRQMTQAEYDAAEHPADTVFYVMDGDSVRQYIGDTELSSGSISAGQLTTHYAGTTATTAGILTEEE